MFTPKKERPRVTFKTNNNMIQQKKYECKHCSATFYHIENYDLHYKLTHKSQDSCSVFGLCILSPIE